MNLNSIPAFDDNYIWVLNDEAGRCLIVDPGDAEPVLNAIAANNWQPEAIFLTHHHHDHVGGVKELVEKFPQIVVYGPQETQDKGTTKLSWLLIAGAICPGESFIARRWSASSTRGSLKCMVFICLRLAI